MKFEELDLVVLTKDSTSFRAGAKLVVLEVEGDRARVGITLADGGEWVNLTDLQKVTT